MIFIVTYTFGWKLKKRDLRGKIPTPPDPPTTRTNLEDDTGDDDAGGEVWDSSVTAAESDIDL